MDTWTPQMIAAFKKLGGNAKINAIWEARLDNKSAKDIKPTENSDRSKRREFIIEKYEYKRWHASSSAPVKKTTSTSGGYGGKSSPSPSKTDTLYPSLGVGKGGHMKLSDGDYEEGLGGESVDIDSPENSTSIANSNLTPSNKSSKKKKRRVKKKKGKEDSKEDKKIERGASLLSGEGDGDEEDMYFANHDIDFDGDEQKSLRSYGLKDSGPIVPERPGPPIMRSPIRPNPPRKAPKYTISPSKQDLKAVANQMTEKERIDLMTKVKTGRMTKEEAMQIIQNRAKKSKSRPQLKPRPPRGPPPSGPPTTIKPSPANLKVRANPKMRASMSLHFAGFDDAFGPAGPTGPNPAAPTDPFASSQKTLPSARATKRAPKLSDKETTKAVKKVAKSNIATVLQGARRVCEFIPGPMGLMTSGQRISRVTEGGQAARQGVQVGWRLIEVANVPVSNNNEVVRELKKLLEKKMKFTLTFLIPVPQQVPPSGPTIAKVPEEDPVEEHSSDNPAEEDEEDEDEDDDIDVPSVPYQKQKMQATPFDGKIDAPVYGAVGSVSPGTRTPVAAAAPAPSPLPATQRGKVEWKAKVEKVTTQTVQAVMVLRGDSIKTKQRIEALESKSLSIPGAKLQELLVRMQRKMEGMSAEIKSLRQENEQMKKMMKHIVNKIRGDFKSPAVPGPSPIIVTQASIDPPVNVVNVERVPTQPIAPVVSVTAQPAPQASSNPFLALSNTSNFSGDNAQPSMPAFGGVPAPESPGSPNIFAALDDAH
eukprot:CAMPEP_0167750826 /NCGR_PEP_ID=MMETSP0110_2-20121227/6208_1 /TAXON_ID=629695 /ORGANISM="Gymnochlora sp., Strain CCMP2014" /LENGTH=761 /DNA_ID=CAMNT_0007636193 /DNA_START=103 /DNA_END=2388 /DNA_ORIENTATION=+